MRVIEPLDKFAGRVIKNGGVAARLDLPQHLHDDGGFAAASVADDLEVLVLGAQRDTQHLAAMVHFEADTLALNGLVKLLWSHEHRPLQAPPVLHFLATANVLANGERKLRQQRDHSEDEWPLKQTNTRCSVVDLLLEVAYKRAVLIDRRCAAVEISHAALARAIRQNQPDAPVIPLPRPSPP